MAGYYALIRVAEARWPWDSVDFRVWPGCGPLDRTSVLSRRDHVTADTKNPVQLPEPSAAEQEFAQQLIERAKTDGIRT